MLLFFFYFPIKVAGENPWPPALNDNPVRAMFDKSTDHGNDVMVVQFVFLFLLRKIFAVKPAVCGFSWVLNILTSFLWPIRVQTRENKLLMSIC